MEKNKVSRGDIQVYKELYNSVFTTVPDAIFLSLLTAHGTALLSMLLGVVVLVLIETGTVERVLAGQCPSILLLYGIETVAARGEGGHLLGLLAPLHAPTVLLGLVLDRHRRRRRSRRRGGRRRGGRGRSQWMLGPAKDTVGLTVDLACNAVVLTVLGIERGRHEIIVARDEPQETSGDAHGEILERVETLCKGNHLQVGGLAIMHRQCHVKDKTLVVVIDPQLTEAHDQSCVKKSACIRNMIRKVSGLVLQSTHPPH